MKELQQNIFSLEALNMAKRAAFITALPEDRDAATVAILVRAIELATPELSRKGRRNLFLDDENDTNQ